MKHGWKAAVGMPGWNPKHGFGMLLEGNNAIHGWDIVVFKLLMQRDVLNGVLAARELGQKIVVDVDDWFKGLSPSNNAYKSTDPATNPEQNRDIYEQIIMEAFAVTCSTPFLYDHYSKLRKNVFMVRNGIDIQRWRRKQMRNTHKTRVGWVGATPWRSFDLEQISGFFGRFIQDNNLLFHHSGHTTNAPKANQLLGVPDQLTRLTPLVPILSYPGLFRPIDIGMVPLNNIDFNHAKSFIKGLEYAAAGVPFIASYSPEYEYLSQHGIGRMAANESEWLYHLNELLDFGIRRDEAIVNSEILPQFSIAERGKDWDLVMREILEQKI